MSCSHPHISQFILGVVLVMLLCELVYLFEMVAEVLGEVTAVGVGYPTLWSLYHRSFKTFEGVYVGYLITEGLGIVALVVIEDRRNSTFSYTEDLKECWNSLSLSM